MTSTNQSSEFFVATGVLLQVRIYYESIGGGFAPTLHQDFWLRYPNGQEQNLHLTGCSLPMRQGHTVSAIWRRNQLAAVMNHVTGQYLNLSSWWSFMPDPQDEPLQKPTNEILRVVQGPWGLTDLLLLAIWGLLLLGAILANSPVALASILPGVIVPFWLIDRRRQRQRLQNQRAQVMAAVNAMIQRTQQQLQ